MNTSGTFRKRSPSRSESSDPEREDCDTVYPAFDHAANRSLHAFGIVCGRSEKDFIIVLDRDVLEGLDNLWEERVGDVRNNQSENSGSPRD